MIDPSSSKSRGKRKRPSAVSFEALVSPNFDELAQQYKDFSAAWKAVRQQQSAKGGSFAVNVTEEFSAALTKALLHVHWNLSLPHLPLHHLCPPVPNRFFYVKWLQQTVLPATARDFIQDSNRTCNREIIVGLDIGTGPMCIYPLLFSAALNNQHEACQFYATDVDPAAVEMAQLNVASNQLQQQIAVYLVPPPTLTRGPLLQSLLPLASQHKHVDVCMTNPPFFDSNTSEQQQLPRDSNFRQRTSMTASEGSYPGGELVFVEDIIADSLSLLSLNPSLVPTWCSCMCGKKTSWIQLTSILTQLLGPSHVLSTTFGPGPTMRWFLAWTFLQPCANATHAKTDGFAITIAGIQRQEALARVQEYLTTSLGTELTVKWSSVDTRLVAFEAHPTLPMAFEPKHNLPAKLQEMVTATRDIIFKRFLPEQGNIWIQVAVHEEASSAKLQVELYAHSAFGKRVVDKIKLQLKGEVCRTNRKWRRQLQRQTAQDMDVA
jgi:23S rRNA A1618 N6-methylase RlmF